MELMSGDRGRQPRDMRRQRDHHQPARPRRTPGRDRQGARDVRAARRRPLEQRRHRGGGLLSGRRRRFLRLVHRSGRVEPRARLIGLVNCLVGEAQIVPAGGERGLRRSEHAQPQARRLAASAQRLQRGRLGLDDHIQPPLSRADAERQHGPIALALLHQRQRGRRAALERQRGEDLRALAPCRTSDA
eukprot:scaffold45576_cov67-Phaeocystis_antarctica.AAC.8